MPGICAPKRTLAERRCRFLALLMQQGPANDSKGRHKAKVENRRNLRKRRPYRQHSAKRRKERLTFLFPPVNRRVAGSSPARGANSSTSYGRDLGRVVINCDQSGSDAFSRLANGAVEHLCVDIERRIDLGVAHQLRDHLSRHIVLVVGALVDNPVSIER